MSEKPDVTMGEMTKQMESLAGRCRKKSYGRSAQWLWRQLFRSLEFAAEHF